MPILHDRKQAQRCLARIETAETLAFCCVEIAPRVTLVQARRISSPNGLKGELKTAEWAGQPALSKGEKTSFRIIAQGFLRLQGRVLQLESSAADSLVEKRLRDYFRTGFNLPMPWESVAVASLAESALPVGAPGDKTGEAAAAIGRSESAQAGGDPIDALPTDGAHTDGDPTVGLAPDAAAPGDARAEGDGPSQGAGPASPPAAEAAPPPAPPPEAADIAPLAALKARMEQAIPALRLAMQRHPAERGGLGALAAGFLAASKAGDLAAADAQLQALTARLEALRDPAGTVAYAKLRLDWESARNGAAADLQRLEAAILDSLEGEPEYEQARSRVRKLDQILATLGTALQDKLDEAASAAGPDRALRRQEALALIAQHRGYVAEDPFLAAIDSNPFVAVAVQARLAASLAGLAGALTSPLAG